MKEKMEIQDASVQRGLWTDKIKDWTFTTSIRREIKKKRFSHENRK